MSQKGVGPDWYPAEVKARAVVDAALDWYHGNIRPGAAKLFWHRMIAPQDPNSPLLAQQALTTLETSFKVTAGLFQGDWMHLHLEGSFISGHPLLKLISSLIVLALEKVWQAVRKVGLPLWMCMHASLHQLSHRERSFLCGG